MFARGGIELAQIEAGQDIECVQHRDAADEGGDAETMRAPWYSPTNGLRSTTR